MKVVMVSTDRKLFEKNSDVAKRTIALGSVLTGLHVIVFTRRGHGHAVTSLGHNITAYPTNSLSRFSYIRDAIALGRLAGSADIVTAQDPFETGYAALKISRALKAPLQLQIHTDFTTPTFKAESWLNRVRVLIARYTLPRAVCVRAVSSRIVGAIEPLIADHPSRPAIIPVYTDVGNFAVSGGVPLKASHPEFRITVLMVGRLQKEKNFPLALEAFAAIVKRYPWVGLFIAGDGPEKRRLKRKVKQLGIENNVVFLGWVTNPSSVFRGADFFLFSSDYEGYGLALVEAAAARIPIVTTNVGLVGELLKDNVHCLVCETGDSACLAQKLSMLIEDNQLRLRLSVSASEAVAPLAEKSVQQYAEEIKNTLATCMGDARDARGAATS